MSQNIVDEVIFFAHSFLMGIVITFVYDGFVVLRRIVKHNLLLISLEDMVFWIACAIGVFSVLCEENNGVLRWFAVFGAALGMIAYKESVSDLFVKLMSALIRHILHALHKIVSFLFRPLRFCAGKSYRILGKCIRKSRRAEKYAKNKLTRQMKLLKMILCKHKERDD